MRHATVHTDKRCATFKKKKMKKILYLFISIILISCDNDDLTEINGDGTGGISCLVDGKLLRPSGGGIYGNRTARFDSYDDGTEFIILGLSNRQEQFEGLAFLTLLLYDVDRNDIEGRVFELKNQDTPESYGNLRLKDFDNNFETNENFTGQVTVIKLDLEKRVISGTFSFTGENSEGETVEITQGRFDMRI